MRPYILFLMFFLLYINASLVLSDSNSLFEVNTYEEGKVISYYNEYYVVNVSGTINIYNGYNSTMFEVLLPVHLPYLNFLETSDTNYFQLGYLRFVQFEPHETKTIKYSARGVTPEDPMINNMSVIMTAMYNRRPQIYSTLVTKIEKAPIEQIDINTSNIRSVKNRRVVTVILQNIADTEWYNITSIKVIKTPSENISNELKRWNYPTDEPYVLLGKYGMWREDIVDYNCTEGEVYWLSADINMDIDSFVNGSHNVMRFTQDDLFHINKTLNESEDFTNLTEYLEHLVFMRKRYSKTTLIPGDIIDVNIRINNFAPVSRPYNLTDYIPFGFNVLSSNGAYHFDNQTALTWEGTLNPDSTTLVNYSLEYIDEDSLGLDYFEPAVLKYGNDTFYSQRVSFIRKYLPEKKVFVQKKLRSSINDGYVVTIKLQNMGESSINDIRVKEFLDANNPFSEITIAPEGRGLWSIPELKKDEIWEVSYVTNDNKALTTLPAILGVKDSFVLKTLVFENTIKNEWKVSNIRLIEGIGVGVLIALPIILIILNRKKRAQNKEHAFSAGENRDATFMQRGADSINSAKSSTTAALNRENAQASALRQANDAKNAGRISNSYANQISENENKREARDNIKDLRKIHDEIGHNGDKV